MSNKDLVIYGAWYLSDVLSELAIDQGWNVIGRVDPQPPDNTQTLKQLPEDACYIVAIGDNAIRRYVMERLRSCSRRLISLVHETAAISPSAQIGNGCYIGEHSSVRSRAVLGHGTIINAGTVIGHHVIIGDYVMLGSNAAIASRGTIEDGTLFGVGACMKPACNIGSSCIIGAGAVVVGDIDDGTIAIGNPARPMKTGDNKRQERQSDWRSNRLW